MRLFLLVLSLFTAPVQPDSVPTEWAGLAGAWRFEEPYRPAQHRRNPMVMQIGAIVAERTEYSDGYFRYRWDGYKAESTGYYRGDRAWFTTRRLVAGRPTEVLYSGRLSKPSVWTGTARPTELPGSPTIPTWTFTATRLSP